MQFRIGALRVFGALLGGSNSTKSVTANHLHVISEALLDRDLMTSDSVSLLFELAKLVSTIISSELGLLKSDDKASYNYFLILSFLLSTEGSDKVPGFTELKTAVSRYLANSC